MTHPNVTTRALLERNANVAPDAPFVVHDGGSWSNSETLTRSMVIASGLQALGVEPGERVASWLPNGPEGVLSLFGVNLAGAAQAPMNIAYKGGLLEHAINLSGARVLIAHDELLDRLDGLDLPNLETIVVLGTHEGNLYGRKSVPWAELEAAPIRDLPTNESWDDMLIVYTSGTTGPSKGVRCSYLHHQGYADYLRVGDLGSQDRALINLPLYHVGATAFVYALLNWGGSIALPPRFATETFWSDVRRLDATTGVMLGAMATFLLEEPPRDDDLDNPLRVALATPSIPRWPEFSRRFGVELWCGFSMTEVPGPLRSALPASDLSTAGAVISADWDVRLVDDYDTEVAPGTPGEMIVRHAKPWTITHGYLGMPEATAESWRNGWFHTGDVLVKNPDGSFIFVDRRKDALRRRGENISSVEVEVEILAYPGIVEAAVVAASSAFSEDEVLAFVVLRPGADFDHTSFIEFLVPRMPHYMVPRYVDVVDELPRTPTGKVRKVELRERGVGQSTWDREAAGLILKSTRLTTYQASTSLERE